MVKLSIFLSILVSLIHPVISNCPNGTYTLPSVVESNWPCILFRSDPYMFTDAEYFCERYDGRLFSVPNGFVNILVTDFINADYPNVCVWIGVTQLVGGIWKNVDNGKNATYFNWAVGEPVNYSGYNCVYMDSQGYWYTYNCSGNCISVCGVPETEATSSPKIEENGFKPYPIKKAD